ncbi:MAG TPA: branched-chain amino acid ABC transporter permease [Burkholderiales bacterium]
MNAHRIAIAAFLVVVVALAVLPLAADKFYVQFFAKIMIMAILAMSLDLLLGYTGLVSFGHAAFYGAAGYALALLTPQYQAANFWTSFPLAVAASALLALVIGFFVVRTRGVYFIMVTLAFAQMLFFLFFDTKIAGGSDGIYIDVRPVAKIGGWEPFRMDDFTHVYYLALVLLVLTYALLRLILRSPFGRVLAGIRVNEQRMLSLGYPTFRYKLACFVISGAIAGIAGYLSAVQFGVVNPEMLGWHLSAAVMMMVILGGMGTLIGPAIGAAIWMLLELGLQSLPSAGGVDLGKHWQLLMGGFIVFVALLLPNGLISMIALLRGRKSAIRG